MIYKMTVKRFIQIIDLSVPLLTMLSEFGGKDNVRGIGSIIELLSLAPVIALLGTLHSSH